MIEQPGAHWDVWARSVIRTLVPWMRIIEDTKFTLGQIPMVKAYTVSTLPSASQWPNGVIIVTDEVGGGPTLATSDATNWKRVSDGATVS